MRVPRALREQLKAYEAQGFHPVKIEQRAGSHFKVVFAEFSAPQIISKNLGDSRALLNNITRYRRLAKEETK